jgi:hypothetical protein
MTEHQVAAHDQCGRGNDMRVRRHDECDNAPVAAD